MSHERLEGVDDNLQKVVIRAHELSQIAFEVIYGVRTLEQQKVIEDRGGTRTKNSKHLVGRAVDVAAIVNDKCSYKISLYPIIADAMKTAATELGVQIRWGGAWQIIDIRDWNSDMKSAMLDYIESCKMKDVRPFVDAMHFELY